MWARTLSGGDQLVRILVALHLLAFSYQDHTSIVQGIAIYLSGEFISSPHSRAIAPPGSARGAMR
jgi:hypothetical protein